MLWRVYRLKIRSSFPFPFRSTSTYFSLSRSRSVWVRSLNVSSLKHSQSRLQFSESSLLVGEPAHRHTQTDRQTHSLPTLAHAHTQTQTRTHSRAATLLLIVFHCVLCVCTSCVCRYPRKSTSERTRVKVRSLFLFLPSFQFPSLSIPVLHQRWL